MGMLADIKSHKDVKKVVEKLARAEGTISRVKAKATEAAGEAITTGESVVTSFGFGYARGRFADDKGDWEVWGLPPDLTAGVVAKLMAFTGLFGKYDEHVHAVGTGALCSYGTVKGIELGQAAAEAKPATKGVRPQVGAASRRPWAPQQQQRTHADMPAR
jgi:hypothetical protein